MNLLKAFVVLALLAACVIVMYLAPVITSGAGGAW